MDRYIFSLLLLGSLTACKERSVTTSERASAPDVRSTETVAVPFAGAWISESYLEDIRKLKSPRKAQEASEEVFIQIPGTTMQPANLIYNFHETGYELVALKENEQYRMWEKQNDSLVKAMYTVEILAPDKIKLGKKTFTKINPVIEKKEARILEEILFKGSYATGSGRQVEFKNNGEVTGLEGYRYYAPVIDYFDAGLQIDQVGLGASREALTYFGFKFKGDRLELYTIKCLTFDETEKRCVEVDFGDKAYELKKME